MTKTQIFLILIPLLSSCEVHKRKYRKGWHVEWAHNISNHTNSDKKEEQAKTKSDTNNVVANSTHEPIDATHFFSQQNSAPPIFIKNKILNRSSIFSSINSAVEEIKKRQMGDSATRNKLNPEKKKVRFPYLPLYLSIAAPFIICVAFIVANNFAIQFALLAFAIGIAALVVALVFSALYLKKSDIRDTGLKNPKFFYGIIIAFCLLILIPVALGLIYLFLALLGLTGLI